jgi:hypothetical protein
LAAVCVIPILLCTITATNDNGEGSRSSVVSEYPNTVPDSPTITGLANSNSQDVGGQLTLSWNQTPANVVHNGGDVIIQLDIKDANGNLLGSVMNGTCWNLQLQISNPLSVFVQLTEMEKRSCYISTRGSFSST